MFSSLGFGVGRSPRCPKGLLCSQPRSIPASRIGACCDLARRQSRAISEIIKQPLGLLQNRRAEALGEPTIDWRQQRVRLNVLALVAPQPGEAGRGAQFPELGVLLLCNRDRLAIA